MFLLSIKDKFQTTMEIYSVKFGMGLFLWIGGLYDVEELDI